MGMLKYCIHITYASIRSRMYRASRPLQQCAVRQTLVTTHGCVLICAVKHRLCGHSPSDPDFFTLGEKMENRRRRDSYRNVCRSRLGTKTDCEAQDGRVSHLVSHFRQFDESPRRRCGDCFAIRQQSWALARVDA